MNSKLSLVRTWRSLRSSKRLSVKNETREEHSKIAPPKKMQDRRCVWIMDLGRIWIGKGKMWVKCG
ncbi:hypothetical protein CsSME_00043520 [Camellia sinensis var. sinensis]